MKKLGIAAVSALLFLGSCADKKENRDEFKAEHNKDSLRNIMGDSAVAHSEHAPITAVDSGRKSVDSAESPTDYESKENKPNTEVGGHR